jgi:hypothetical protein
MLGIEMNHLADGDVTRTNKTLSFSFFCGLFNFLNHVILELEERPGWCSLFWFGVNRNPFPFFGGFLVV